MIQRDVATAQIATLREWASLWDADAVPGDGCSEVAFLMVRAARTAEAVVSDLPLPVDQVAIAPPVVMADGREG